MTEFLPIRQEFNVRYGYDVHFTSGLFREDNLLLLQTLATDKKGSPARMLVVVDGGVVQSHRGLLGEIDAYVKRHRDRVQLAAPPLRVPGGEKCKNSVDSLDRVLNQVNELGIDRHSYILAIGGGAVLDMAGYAAALAHRGIRFIRVPTTVLAQCDSGVGVKNGINAFGKKNFLGTFAPPSAVLNDFEFLTTLEDRDWRSGISEAVKVALIKDASFFDHIERHAASLAKRDMALTQQVIYRCAAMHLEHIRCNNDPFEKGSSRPLDFGHWAAHKLEQLTDYELRHGEAVAIGIALDCVYSHLSGLLGSKALERILSTFETLGLQLYSPALLECEPHSPKRTLSVFAGIQEFREHLGGELTLMLLTQIGSAVNVHQVDEALYRRAIHILKER